MSERTLRLVFALVKNEEGNSSFVAFQVRADDYEYRNREHHEMASFAMREDGYGADDILQIIDDRDTAGQMLAPLLFMPGARSTSIERLAQAVFQIDLEVRESTPGEFSQPNFDSVMGMTVNLLMQANHWTGPGYGSIKVSRCPV